jgi:hypothetical protein
MHELIYTRSNALRFPGYASIERGASRAQLLDLFGQFELELLVAFPESHHVWESYADRCSAARKPSPMASRRLLRALVRTLGGPGQVALFPIAGFITAMSALQLA